VKARSWQIKRHKKEVAGLVSGVESDLSKERLGIAYNSRDWRSVRQHTKLKAVKQYDRTSYPTAVSSE